MLNVMTVCHYFPRVSHLSWLKFAPESNMLDKTSIGIEHAWLWFDFCSARKSKCILAFVLFML